jgi:capsular exopolysaccharide synthesis family protein
MQGSGHNVATLQQSRVHGPNPGLSARAGPRAAPEFAPTCILFGAAIALICDMRKSGERVAAVSDLLEGRGMAPDNLPAIRVQAAPAASRLPPSSFAAAAVEETGLDWRRIASALWRFKWVLFLSATVGIGAGAGATRILRPAYVAQATVWIDVPDHRDGPDRGPIRPGGLFTADAWVDLLRSYFVLDHVVRDLGLYLELESQEDTARFAGFNVAESFRPGDYRLRVDPAGRSYVLSTSKGIELERGTVGDSVGTRLGFRWAPPAAALPASRGVVFSLATPRDAALKLGERLQVQMDLNGNFLKVELRGPQPRPITAILNAITQRYVDVAGQLKRERLTQLTKILEDQLNIARRSLGDAENALQTFRKHTITLPSDHPTASSAGAGGRDPVFTSFFDMQLERERLRRDREAIENLLARAGDSGVAMGALGLVGSVAQNPELSQALKELADKQAGLRGLRYHYTDDYPTVQHLAAEIAQLEHHTIPTLARNLTAELATHEAELGRQVTSTASGLREIPARALEEEGLHRGVTLAEQLYLNLEARFEEARLAAEASEVPDVRILDPAMVPQRPVKNSMPQLLLMGLLGGLGLGVVGVIVLDRVDPRVRYPEQVSRELGLPILGAVPHVKDAAGPAEVVEALRGLSFNLLHAYGSAGPLLLTITSPGPGDGKSFLASNLALSFADSGRRTLLVDGDVRRGTLHRRFHANRKPGLIDFLRGDTACERIIQSTSYPWLCLIGCGTRSNRAPELLGAAAMGQLLATVRSQFDVIVIDSPPLGAGVDPFILGTVAGNLLLVLRTGYSHRDVVGAKLGILNRLPVRILGAVLNDVPRGAAYGYSSYYSYYLPGYEAVDEDEGLEAARPRIV